MSVLRVLSLLTFIRMSRKGRDEGPSSEVNWMAGCALFIISMRLFKGGIHGAILLV